jgi:O-antigen/teichoic acid export membrane protein
MDSDVHVGDIDLSTIKSRSVSGIVTLISRSFVQRIISSVGFFALTVFLDRPEIGLFIVINDLVSILGYFSDIGLAASLVQKKDKVTVSDLQTTFTLQQLIVVVSCLVMIFISPKIFTYYSISGGGVWLFYSLLVAFFLASLKTIPSVILERQLKFEVLATVEVLETIIFYGIAVLLAWKGFGVSSYALAVLLRGVFGTAMLYRTSPWPIGLNISKSSLKTLLSFGIPYQINSLMAVVKDRFVNVALLKIIGADGVGIIGWAQSWSQLPLRFVMDNVTKVTFPSFARLQDHKEELKKAIEKTLFFITLLSFPILAGMATLAPQLVHLIPKYGKWEAALVPLVLYCFNSALASISTPLTNTLNALGKVKINTYLMIMWTALTWGLTPLLAIKFGFVGVSYATAIITISSFVPVVIIKKYINFDFIASISKPTIASLAMIIISWYMTKVLPQSLFMLLVNISISGLVYCLVVLSLVGESLVKDVKKFAYAFFKKK